MKLTQKLKNDGERDARHQLIEELFYDFYTNRRRVYSVNFFRGMFFGLGTVLGGTIVVALLIWILGQFVGIFPPIIGDFITQIIQAMKH